MKTHHKYIILSTATLSLIMEPSISMAKSFKAKYYKECYAPVSQIEPLLEERSGVGGNAKTLQKAGGLFGKVGGFVGLGGAANTVNKVNNTVSTVNKYSSVISDVSAYMGQMKQDHPDDNQRLEAYSDHMVREAEDLNKVQMAIGEAQTCYDTAYNNLGIDVAEGKMKSKSAKKNLKEIQKGTKYSGEKLLAAMKRLNTNIKSYDQSLGLESKALGIVLPKATGNAYSNSSYHSLSQLASYSHIHPSAGTHIAASAVDSALSLKNAQKTESEKEAQKILPGIQKAGLSSQTYLELYDNVQEKVETQKELEAKIKKNPW